MFDDARAERDFRQNPPTDAPMQGEGLGWDDMPIGSSSVEDIQGSFQSDINSTLGGVGGYGLPSSPMQSQNQQVSKSTEEIVKEGSIVVAKGLWKFIKLFVQSVQNNNSTAWHMFGVKTTTVSVACAGVSLFGMVWEAFNQNGNKPVELLIGSLLSMFVGVHFMMKYDIDPNDTDNTGNATGAEPSEDFSGWGDSDFSFDDDDSDSAFDEFIEEEEEMTEDDWGDLLEGISSFEEEQENSINSDDFDAKSVVDSLTEITPGTQTRQYLFEAFTKVLPLVTPDYSEMKEISPDCDEFYVFENYLRTAAEQVGTKEENIPELLNLYENPFVYKMSCSRPVGMKEQMIADEISKAYAWNEDSSKKKLGVYSKIETAPGICVISVFKGFILDPITNKQIGGVAISLGDIYRQISQFVCNSSVEFPFVWGVNEKGNTLYCDMKDNNTIIISGMPRGGKSWKGQSIVAQFAMFNSPSEVNFYILDNKDTASDYRYLSEVLPHVKYFCGRFDKINDSLERIINMMLNTNGKKLEEAGEINIKDYNKKHPTEKLPYVYVVIDELQALMNYYEESDQKEEAQRFRGYLSTMTSKLPYTGLRFIMFPHRIVNQIISKNTYTLVSSRVVVNQLDGKEVENAVGVSEAKFGYKLAQKGDMAIRLSEVNGGEACFCHAEMLSDSNSGNRKLFEYIGSVWKKLEPGSECIKIVNSIGGKIETGAGAKQVARVAKDNTEGQDTYKYDGFNTGSAVSDLEDEGYLDLGLKDDEVGLDISEDEDFWNSIESE